MSRLAASSRISGASSTIAVAFLLTLAALVGVLSPRAALAQDGAGAPSAGPGGGTLAVHGYLTQGWGKTSGPQFYGLTDVGSTDFRYAAIQFRYDRKNDGLVV
ncbi:MAG TPA: hypothetical protein VFJ74_09130, partial [Gemmatimonadaceae bacterium]|nr:hypothetical protein [Gemmatimonadaceae bacterium]